MGTEILFRLLHYAQTAARLRINYCASLFRHRSTRTGQSVIPEDEAKIPVQRGEN